MPETRQTQRPTLRGDGYDLPPTLEVETLRQAAPTAAAAASPKGEERLPIFWRIFGSTVLSIAALVAMYLISASHAQPAGFCLCHAESR